MSEREERDRDREIEYGYRHIDIDIDGEDRGRPREFSDRKHTRTYQLYISRSQANSFIMLKTILKREGRKINDWFFENAETYVRLHEPGNPQQRLDTILKIGKAYHSPGKICGFKDCLRDAVGIAMYLPRNEPYGFCQVHAKVIKDNASLWKLLK